MRWFHFSDLAVATDAFDEDFFESQEQPLHKGAAPQVAHALCYGT